MISFFFFFLNNTDITNTLAHYKCCYQGRAKPCDLYFPCWEIFSRIIYHQIVIIPFLQIVVIIMLKILNIRIYTTWRSQIDIAIDWKCHSGHTFQELSKIHYCHSNRKFCSTTAYSSDIARVHEKMIQVWQKMMKHILININCNHFFLLKKS